MASKFFVIVIDGPMGAGKTTASKLLHERLEGTARIALADVKRFISGFEKDHRFNKISQEVILVMVDEYLKRGISVIVEWAMKQERADSLRAIANTRNAKWYLYQLTAPKELLFKRVKERTRTMLGVESLPERNILNITENFEKNYAFHIENKSKEGTEIDSEKHAADEIVAQIIRSLDLPTES